MSFPGRVHPLRAGAAFQIRRERRGRLPARPGVERPGLIWETDGLNAKSPSSWREVMVRTRPEVNRSTQAVQVASIDACDCIHGPPAGVFNESRELRSPHCETRIVSACELRVSHVGAVSQ